MRFSVLKVDVIEMTREEQSKLWDTPAEERKVLGRKVLHWLTDDGINDIRLEGDCFYRPVIISNEIKFVTDKEIDKENRINKIK
jgi:hypothetical protein